MSTKHTPKIVAIALGFAAVGTASFPPFFGTADARREVVAGPAEVDMGARRSGGVRLDGRSLADHGGKFNALGASLFYGA